MEQIACNYCQKTQTKFLPRETRYLRLPDPYKVVECTNCHLVYMNPRMTAKEYEEFYSSKYYRDYDYDKILSNERNPKFVRRIQLLNSLRPNRGRLLDIGTATGEFLNAARRGGWQVFGTEVSRYAAEMAKIKYGIDVFIGDAADAPFEPHSFDVVHLSHVLEHVPDPRLTIRLARSLLRSGGLFVVEVPHQFGNWFERIAELLGRRHPTAEESLHHVYFYTPRSLRRLFAAEGFDVRIHTYSLDVPYAHLPNWAHVFLAPVSRLIDRLGGGLYIEAYGTPR